MSLILDGTNGLSDVDGTAATPAIRGTDTNTGIFFPAADTIAFAEGGTEVARFDSAGNLGIGTTSPLGKLAVVTSSGITGYGSSNSPTLTVHASNRIANQEQQIFTVFTTDTATVDFGGSIGLGGRSASASGEANSYAQIAGRKENATNANYAGYLQFSTSDSVSDLTERMRIDSNGRLFVGTTSSLGGSAAFNLKQNADGWAAGFQVTTNGNYGLACINAAGSVVGGAIIGASSTTFATSSDYRLKENIAPMTGALAKVAQLKPVTYKWKSTNEESQGFIAHELQEIVPDCVVGDKDAIDAEGNPQYQGIDTSFLVATLTAAIQELKATVDAQAVRIAALEGAAV
jgi:hypothetical protein